MTGYQCPYCQMVMSISDQTRVSRYPAFNYPNGVLNAVSSQFADSCVEIQFFYCPNCGEYSVFAKGKGEGVSSINAILKPASFAKKFPEYVPQGIREDYEEACAIVSLSPKASATLSRRCLQGMIRDFWGIKGDRLIDEIDALKDKVPAAQWNVLDSLRRLGNIGAHPEADVNLIIDINPEDAQKLISVIELLIEQWYVNRFEQERLFQEVGKLDEKTQTKKHEARE